jgi:hypothetical protein
VQIAVETLAHRAPSFAGPRVADSQVNAAIERVLLNPDSFQEWLGGECAYTGPVTCDYDLRRPERLVLAKTPTLVAAALLSTERGDAETLLQVMQLIKARYLKAMDSHVGHLAGEIANEGL